MAYQLQHEGYAQPRQQQQQYYEQEQQYAGYDGQYEQQQHYGQGYAQGAHEQWDNGQYGHYDQYDQYNAQQNGGWESAQQQGAYNNVNGHARQAPQQQGRRPPPQNQYAQEQAHNGHHQQQPRQDRDPRSRRSSRGDGSRPPPQQKRTASRPPGLDRSLFNPVSPKNAPLDNPFPAFPSQKPKPKPKPPATTDKMTQAMSLMNVGEVGAQSRQRGPPPRGQHMPPQNTGLPQGRTARSGSDGRQDSGQFEGNAQNRRPPPQRMPPGQRPPPMDLGGARGPPPPRQFDPKSPSQQLFGPNTKRSVTMPQSLPSAGPGRGHDEQDQWPIPGTVTGYHGPESPAYIPTRPSTAGGTRPNNPPSQFEQQPPMPRMPPPRQHPQQHSQQQQRQYPPHQHQQLQIQQGNVDNYYDDYHEEPHNHHRISEADSIEMPNFDAIPETSHRHRRGDSIDDHLSANPVIGNAQYASPTGNAPPQSNNFQRQASHSPLQHDLHGQYADGAYELPGDNMGTYELPGDAPPMSAPSRANTGFAGPNGLPNGPRGRGPPPRAMTSDNFQQARGPPPNFDPRYGRQPPPVHREYSDNSAYSEPPPNTMRNISSPPPGNFIPRPGTTTPASGRAPGDFHGGQRSGTVQPQTNPDALPIHPTPIRAGLIQQNQQQQQPNQSGRPPPVRQYNNDRSRISYESQNSISQRPVSMPHPVTHDELNRLRNTWKANSSDSATGLLFAKKLVEAASVLSDEGGTADTRTRNKNREKYILEGHKIIKKLAHNGYTEAMFYLADCYGQGLLGLQVDTKEAFTLYQSAAKAGHPASAYRTAVCCEMGHEEGGGTKRDPLKAVQWYRRAAALGDPPALYKMGMILLKGLLGQQKNFGEAINMLKRAADRADKDNPHALHELALIYEAQTGNERIIQDEAYALQLFHQAADLRYKFSQFRLGQAYEYGLLGCQIDARTSIAWYTKAATQEEHQSELALSGWYLTGVQGVLEQSDTEAYLWARKAACAEPPLPKALFAMGYFTEVGIGCPRSLDEAKRWYGRAAGKLDPPLSPSISQPCIQIPKSSGTSRGTQTRRLKSPDEA
ncbi:hypothetical protein P153DRAFT_206862 [Dothidotthia symphoricarpi CBS 119687]|uniref:HCP-like protein n=1 Tax=Dothidotthia symphoricarpi CBS 119687 TaxID=1392245 RepID=A0A6A6AG18_9PLEO|nr:uncharacterized protein P153DRAFT_206862 [Dothidotthia symphoricarpi CBS 119687]KAF2130922.1 hypothetical protein P153DRAFT_206862 [Dothidotthia symphoricarpi CBS 119687]